MKQLKGGSGRNRKAKRSKSSETGLRKKVLTLQRQVLVLENLRRRKIQNSNQAEGELKILAMGIAHEFNNILGAVDGHAEWALESKNPSDWKESLEIIRTACVRSAEITAALRGWGQPREDQKKLIKIADLFRDVTRMMKPLMDQAQIKFEVKSVPGSIYGNATELMEVLVNLLKNSIEALELRDASRGKSIQLRAQLHKKDLQIDVIDNGVGVPVEFRKRIFEPFFTLKGVLSVLAPGAAADQPRPQTQKGSGLGLYLSRSIITEHGGQISLQSTDIGTHFKINLPLTDS